MKRFITIILISIMGAILMTFVLSGCFIDNKTAVKNKEIITVISDNPYITSTIFRDTETGREYIVFSDADGLAVTPRLLKEEL